MTVLPVIKLYTEINKKLGIIKYYKTTSLIHKIMKKPFSYKLAHGYFFPLEKTCFINAQ